MSSYPITGCGLPSKPRVTEPSMFEILSWAGDDNLAKSTFELPQYKYTHHNVTNQPQLNYNNFTNDSVNPVLNPCCKINEPQLVQAPNEQIYKQHKSPEKLNQSKSNSNTIPQIVVDHNQPKVFQKSHLFIKQIKHQLNSYEPANLKASRAKSTNIPKTDQPQKLNPKKEPVELDEKTIKERKQKLKEFQLFTRILPNSAFTTYYGKPAFQNYGRGTSYQNLKSFNVMPHKGDNHPKNIESHYTALIKARNIKSKSYLPRKPIEQTFLAHQQQENHEAMIPSLPLQKPDLIKSNRFASIPPETGKKAGPPQTSKRNIQSAKKTVNNASHIRKQKSKSFKQPLGDGLKYLNKRQNLIDILQEKKLKASQLAYKVTECYPIQSQQQIMQKSCVSKQNWDQYKPAGKASNKGQALKDLIESRFILQQNNSKA